MNQWHALGLTLVCELPVLLLLARAQPLMRVLVIAASASGLTHPVAWHIASVLSPDEYPIGIWLIEIVIVLTEALWYQFWLRPGAAKSLLWSLLANASSYSFGWLLLRT